MTNVSERLELASLRQLEDCLLLGHRIGRRNVGAALVNNEPEKISINKNTRINGRTEAAEYKT